MKNLFSFLMCMLLFSTIGLQAQTYTQIDKLDEMSSFNSQNSQLNFLSNQKNITEANNIPNFNGNNIFITQIGEGNVVKSTTKSQTSEIQITQNGKDNTTELNLEAKTIRETILQNGDNNSFMDYNVGSGTVKFHSAEIVQTGDNLNIEWYGNNSISEKLNLSQQGNGYGKTILVRSFSK